MGNSNFLPVPSYRMGLLWTIFNIKESVVLEYGPKGTTHYLNSMYDKFNLSYKNNVYCNAIEEKDLIFGEPSHLEESLKLLSSYKVVFLASSTLASVIGFDTVGYISEIESRLKTTVIPIDFTNSKGDYSDGIRDGLYILAKYIVKNFKNEAENSYNIIGITPDYYNNRSDIKEIKTFMKNVFNMDLNTVFSSDTSIYDIEKSSSAKINIVMREEGIKAAKFLEDKFAIPYIEADLYSIENIITFVKNISNILNINYNIDYVKKKAKECNEAVEKFKHYTRMKNNIKVLLSGDYYVVKGFHNFLEKDLNLTIVNSIVNHNIKENNIFNVKPNDKIKKVIINDDYDIALCDGELSQYIIKPSFQISCPNIKTVLISDNKPFICFNGLINILDELIKLII